MSDFIHRHYIIVPAAARDDANRVASEVDPDNGGINTFIVELSADGSYPPTHYACSTLATEKMRQEMYKAIPQLPGVAFWRANAMTGELMATNISDSEDAIGKPFTFDDALRMVGLIRVVINEDGD